MISPQKVCQLIEYAQTLSKFSTLETSANGRSMSYPAIPPKLSP